jgi:hypothetical protein
MTVLHEKSLVGSTPGTSSFNNSCFLDITILTRPDKGCYRPKEIFRALNPSANALQGPIFPPYIF